MTTEKFLMGRGRDRLSNEDRALIEDSISEVRVIAGRQLMARSGEPIDTSTLLLEGFACSYRYEKSGARQVVGIHIPGDFIDLGGFITKRNDHDVYTIGRAKYATFEHRILTKINESSERMSKILWLSTLSESVVNREWIFRLGLLSAEGRIANLICELYVRLAMVGLVQGGGFHLPLTQPDLGEATGLTGVHINRVLRSLRERNLLEIRNFHVQVFDYEQLAKLGEFDSQHLRILA